MGIKLLEPLKSEIPEYHLEGLIPLLVFHCHKEFFYNFSIMEEKSILNINDMRAEAKGKDSA